MSMLKYWFEHEYARLEAEGKAALVDNFSTFSHAYFSADYEAVFRALPDLYRLAAHLGEPVWRAILSYYAAPAHIYWRGDLARGLELATEAIVQAVNLLGPWDILTHYIREMLLYAWLQTDMPGYVDDVQAALDEALAMPLDGDLEVRFGLVRACCLGENGHPDEAWELLQSLLPNLDWPEPYHHNLRASMLIWKECYEEAIVAFVKATQGFVRLGHTIEANGARIGQGDALAQAGRNDEALNVMYAALSMAERSMNRAQVGQVQGAIGQIMLKKGQPEDALTWLNGALESLDGLGWLRQEAILALERVKACRELAPDQANTTWRAVVLDAGERVARLRSTDLRADLAVLLDDVGDYS